MNKTLSFLLWLGRATYQNSVGCLVFLSLWVFFFKINDYFSSLFREKLMDFNIFKVSILNKWVLNKESWAVESAAFSVKVKLLWAWFCAAADPFKNQDKFAAWILKRFATVSLGHFIGAVHVCYRIQGNLLCSVNCLHWKWKIWAWFNGQHSARRHATAFPVSCR